MRILSIRQILVLFISSQISIVGIGFLLVFFVGYYKSNQENLFSDSKKAMVESYLDYKYELNRSDGNENLWVYLYRYRVGSEIFDGKEIASSSKIEIGAKIKVYYVITNPKLSRIQGLKQKASPVPLIKALLLFAIIFISIGILQFAYKLYFIRNGTVVKAFYESHIRFRANENKSNQNFLNIDTSKNEILYSLTLKYSIDSYSDNVKKFYLVSLKLINNKFDYNLLVDEDKPHRAIIINSLPKSIQKTIYTN